MCYLLMATANELLQARSSMRNVRKQKGKERSGKKHTYTSISLLDRIEITIPTKALIYSLYLTKLQQLALPRQKRIDCSRV